MKKIWFVRHGESESNAGMPSISSGSPPLTQRGREQAQEVSKAILKKPDLIVTSSFIRTQETAAPTIAKFPDVPTEIWPAEEFTYLSSPTYKNTTVAQRRTAGLKYWWRGDPDHNDGPGAESFHDLFSRVQETIKLIENTEAKFILVFSHGWFIRAVIYSLFTQKDGQPKYNNEIVHKLWENGYISRFFYSYFSRRKIPQEQRKMLHYIAFASTFKIPNTTILKFEWKEDQGLEFLEKDTKHIPNSLKGNPLLDR